ncbi:MAG: RHS repeat domain-containing protein, partial [Bacteroidota bacterium]
LIVTLISNFALSQPTNSLLQDVALPAPNAGALAKFEEIPVSHFTGIPNINIPLYILQEGSLSLPISLNYHASGIRLAETASWVGLGWSLSAGGSITRTVQSLPDDDIIGGFYRFGYLVDESYLGQIAQGNMDGEPDIFSFSFPGYSGKFYFGPDSTYHLVPEQDLKIDYILGDIFESFTITTPDGIKYIFGRLPELTYSTEGIENTQFIDPSISPLTNTPNIPTSWHLVNIQSPDEKFSIDLKYSEENYGYKQLSSCRKIFGFCNDALGGTGLGNGDSYCSGRTELGELAYYTLSAVQGKRLDSIICTHSIITFEESDSNRIDLELHETLGVLTAKALKKVSISSGTECKEFILEQNYSIDPSDTTKAEGQRLFLSSIQERSCTDTTISIPAYQFEYYGSQTSDSRLIIPNRLSKAVDHWGFYNGQTGNNSLELNVPKTSVFDPDSNSYFSYAGSALREPDEDSMKIGTLKKIIYPSGGTASFSFEAHQYFGKDYSQDTTIWLKSCSSPAGNCCGEIKDSVENIIFSTESFPLSFFQFTVQRVPGDSCYNEDIAEARISVYKMSDSSYVGGISLDLNCFTSACQTEDSLSLVAQTGTLPISSIYGTSPNEAYKLVLTSTDAWSQFELSYSDIVEGNTLAGGLRIKQIQIHDGINSENDLVKNYSYKDSTGTQSSGVLFQRPNYGVYYSGYNFWYSPFSDTIAIVSIHANSIVPLHSFQGYHIGYSQVKETILGQGNTNFQFGIDTSEIPPIYPFPPFNHNVMEGKLLRLSQNNESGIKVAENQTLGIAEPSYVPDPSSRGDSIGDFMYKVVQIGCTNQDQLAFYTRYSLPTSWYKVTAKIDSIDGVVSKTEYEYDPKSSHQFPIKIRSDASDSRIREQRFKYPLDYQDTLSFGNGSNLTMKALINQHMIGLPIETQVWEGDTSSLKMVSGQIQLYNNFGSGGDSIIKPFQIHILETATPLGQDAIDDDTDASSGLYTKLQPANISSKYVDRASFVYDSIYGNLVQQSLTDGTPISYIWGYSGNRPLAQVVGKTYDQIKSTSVNQLRSTFSDALVTTYTYNDRLQISSITQPNGVVTYYEYDALGRLIRTKDDDSELLQTIEYNYSQP